MEAVGTGGWEVAGWDDDAEAEVEVGEPAAAEATDAEADEEIASEGDEVDVAAVGDTFGTASESVCSSSFS